MVAAPDFTGVATPPVTVATVGSEATHDAFPVTTRVALFDRVAVAMNETGRPITVVGLVGVTAIELTP